MFIRFGIIDQKDQNPLKQHLPAPDSAAAMLSALIPRVGFVTPSRAGGKPAGYATTPTRQLNMAISIFCSQLAGIRIDVFSVTIAESIRAVYPTQGTGYIPVQLNMSAMIVNPAAVGPLGADAESLY